MTSFTALKPGEEPSISLDARNIIADINPNIYGGFVEHMGRCIYGGLYDPGSPLADEDGFRKDVLAAMKDLNPPVMRYPGAVRPELAWLGVETNEFGTDEFMKWCKKLGTEPNLCFNMGTGTLDEALAWLEYCNSSQDTYYANMRRKNGHAEPYNVKYWALGNEVWGPWQVAQSTKEEYAHKAFQWAKALKLLDPTIQLILCGETGFSGSGQHWDAYVLNENIKVSSHGLGGSGPSNLIDMHSLHLYTASKENIPNVLAPRAAERGIEIASALIDLARIENKILPSAPRQTICFDEWNTWYAPDWPGDKGAEQKYNLSDALAVSVWLNVFIRQARNIGMANIAQSVNVLSPLLTTKDSLTKQTIYYPLYLFSKYMRGQSLAVHVRCAEYQDSMEKAVSADGTNFAWLNGMCDLPLLDVSACLSDAVAVDGEEEGKYVSLAVVNASESEQVWPAFDIAGGVRACKVFTVTGAGPAVMNTKDGEEVGISEFNAGDLSDYRLPKASLSLFRWRV